MPPKATPRACSFAASCKLAGRPGRFFHAQAFSSFNYLLSGGYSKPALYPESWLEVIQRWDEFLSRWPRLFGARCLIGLQRT